MSQLRELLHSKKVLICCGSGGVGKTTTSASLALAAAAEGMRAVVCTIDPARRLANSLGLTEIGNEVVQVDPARFEGSGLSPSGSLHALMLDTKGTFDRLIGRYAKSEEERQRIFNNRFYQQMSSTVVGSSDYMAMEKLYELHEDGDFDLIVLDTPPTKHAIDFLQAPKRMSDAFDKSTLEIFLRPWAETSKKSFGFLGRAINRVVRKVDSILGLKFVEDLADFFRAFDGMYDGFRGRAQRVDALLREPFTSFVVVTSPRPLPLQEARFFCDRLREFEMPLDAVIVNRVHRSSLPPGDARTTLRGRISEHGPQGIFEQTQAAIPQDAHSQLVPLLKAFLDHELLAASDRSRIHELRSGAAQGLVVHEVPSFSHDVHDLAGLSSIVTHILRDEAAL